MEALEFYIEELRAGYDEGLDLFPLVNSVLIAWDAENAQGACVECGNDDPAEGQRVCTDCLEAPVPVSRNPTDVEQWLNT